MGLVKCVAVMIVAVNAGCGETDNSTSRLERAQGHATVESLISELNDLASDGDSTALESYYDLWYPENANQRAHLDLVHRRYVPIARLDDAFITQFGRPMQGEGEASYRLVLDNLHLTSRDGQRATALYRDVRGEQRTLHLVNADGVWRVSGYTWEYEVNGDPAQDIEDRQVPDGFKEAIDSVTQRVLNGEFETFQEAFETLLQDARATLEEES